MKILLLVYFALSIHSVCAQATVPPTQYKDMLGKLKLSSSCKNALAQNYNSGKNLALDIIRKSIIPLSQFAISGVDHPDTSTGKVKINGYDFFHYTDHDLGASLFPEVGNRDQAEKLIRQNGGYENIFKYLKQKELYGCCGMDFPTGFYIAEDSFTSSHYGKLRLVLELSPTTQVFKTSLAGELLPPLSWNIVANELTKKSSNITKICKFEELKPIILEDSGVDVVSYAGGDGAWFVMLNSRSINKSKFEKKY